MCSFSLLFVWAFGVLLLKKKTTNRDWNNYLCRIFCMLTNCYCYLIVAFRTCGCISGNKVSLQKCSHLHSCLSPLHLLHDLLICRNCIWNFQTSEPFSASNWPLILKKIIYISTNSIIDKGWRKLNIWDLLRFLFMLSNIEVCIAACLLHFEHESIKECSQNTSSCIVKWFGLEGWTQLCKCGGIARKSMTVVSTDWFIYCWHWKHCQILPKYSRLKFLSGFLPKRLCTCIYLFSMLYTFEVQTCWTSQSSMEEWWPQTFSLSRFQIIPSLHPHHEASWDSFLTSANFHA